MLFQGLAVGPAGGPNGRFIQHIQRCAVTLGQIAETTPPNNKTVGAVEFCGDRGQVAIGALRIPVGLEGPLTGDGLGHGVAASEGNLRIDPVEGGQTPQILRLDPSWQQACLALDQRALNGLWTGEQWRRELDDPRRLCIGVVQIDVLLGCGLWLDGGR
jgi:hypothetical protein